MTDQPEDLDVMIEDYVDGRMSLNQRATFEARMKSDAKLRERVKLATHSAALVEQALGWLKPGDEFDDKVTSKIMSITQSGQSAPVNAVLNRHAQLQENADAKREQKRLMLLGIIAALLFVLAAGAITYSIIQGMQDQPNVNQPQK